MEGFHTGPVGQTQKRRVGVTFDRGTVVCAYNVKKSLLAGSDPNSGRLRDKLSPDQV